MFVCFVNKSKLRVVIAGVCNGMGTPPKFKLIIWRKSEVGLHSHV